ncbi:hypothetical protein ACFLUZ_04360 [Chloroflexota bacterium]
MNKLVQESTDREIIRAIGADEQANTNYYQILRRFISGKAIISGEKSHQPRARLNADSLKEIDAAWLLLQTTGKNLRRAYMKLYLSYL